MKKETVLITVNFLVEVNKDELEKECGDLQNLEAELSHTDGKIISKLEPVWKSSQTTLFDPKSINCGKCSSCGQWTTDREAPEPILQIAYGAKVSGKLLCGECLPSNHYWAF